MFNLKDATVFLTGGTGTFGNAFVKRLLQEGEVKKIIIYSRDEFKQYQMQQRYSNDKRLRFFLGDVRDRDRLYVAMSECDYVVHAAATKQVVASEYNPFEAVKTNILGAQNVVEASAYNGVKKLIALSTDKAANPVNLYGATKLCSDKIFIAANAYMGGKITRYSVVRYGNVLGSRGSVLPLFLKQKETGKITITNKDMTRFWMTIEQAVSMVLQAMELSSGSEIFVPKTAAMRMEDFAKAVAPECDIEVVGIRPGEKMHEVMIPRDEAPNTKEYKDHYRIFPAYTEHYPAFSTGEGVDVHEDFEYASNSSHTRVLSEEELLAATIKIARKNYEDTQW